MRLWQMVVTNGRAVARGCGGAMAGAHTTGVADNRAEIWLGREIGVWRARCSSWKAVEVSGTCSS